MGIVSLISTEWQKKIPDVSGITIQEGTIKLSCLSNRPLLKELRKPQIEGWETSAVADPFYP
jgi:hypothetical protein